MRELSTLKVASTALGEPQKRVNTRPADPLHEQNPDPTYEFWSLIHLERTRSDSWLPSFRKRHIRVTDSYTKQASTSWVATPTFPDGRRLLEQEKLDIGLSLRSGDPNPIAFVVCAFLVLPCPRSCANTYGTSLHSMSIIGIRCMTQTCVLKCAK